MHCKTLPQSSWCLSVWIDIRSWMPIVFLVSQKASWKERTFAPNKCTNGKTLPLPILYYIRADWERIFHLADQTDSVGESEKCIRERKRESEREIELQSFVYFGTKYPFVSHIAY